MYKEASKMGLRFPSDKGNLTVEQLWSLKEDELDAMAINLEAALEKRVRKSFIRVVSNVDQVTELRFNIVLDVLGTKVSERMAKSEEAEIKRHNQEILSLVADIEKEDMKKLSKAELLKQLR